MAWLGHSGSQTSQLTQASVIIKATGGFLCEGSSLERPFHAGACAAPPRPPDGRSPRHRPRAWRSRAPGSTSCSCIARRASETSSRCRARACGSCRRAGTRIRNRTPRAARGAQVILRGLRELHEQGIESADLDVVAAAEQYSYISSSLVREIATLGGDVSD